MTAFGLSVFVLAGIGSVYRAHLPEPDLSSPPPQIKDEPHSSRIRKFGIDIKKIGVLAPVIKNVDGVTKSIYDQALKKGIAHFKGAALPGQGSNTFLFAHSGPTPKDEAKRFTRLNELGVGDRITVYYQGERFDYSVFEKKIVEKTDTGVLDSTEKEQLTLMTCWPVGKNEKRLIVKASLVD